MLDQVGIEVSDCARSRAFDSAAFEPLDMGVLGEHDGGAMIGNADVRPWIDASGPAATPACLAFHAAGRAAVRALVDAALVARSRDNGRRGLRAQHAPGYDAAFVLDLEGRNVEVVTTAGE